jgi:hypothetical protein
VLDKVRFCNYYIWGKYPKYKDFIRLGNITQSAASMIQLVENCFYEFSSSKYKNSEQNKFNIFVIDSNSNIDIITIFPSKDEFGRGFFLAIALSAHLKFVVNWAKALSCLQLVTKTIQKRFEDGNFDQDLYLDIDLNSISNSNYCNIDLSAAELKKDVQYGFENIYNLNIVRKPILPLIIFQGKDITRLLYCKPDIDDFKDFFIRQV